MGNKVENVSAGMPKIEGAFWVAPVGTTLPTDTSTQLDVAFKGLGYISEDGFTNANSPTSNNVKAWGGDTVLSTQSDRPDTFKVKYIESTNVDVLKLIYGDENVSGTLATGITVKANALELEEHAYVIDMILRNKTAKRIVIPRAKVSQIADIVYKGTDAIGYETTLEAFADSTGQTHYEYLKAAQAPEGKAD